MRKLINKYNNMNSIIDSELESIIILLILVKLKFRYTLGTAIHIGSELLKIFKDPNHKLRKYLPKNLIDDITKTEMVGEEDNYDNPILDETLFKDDNHNENIKSNSNNMYFEMKTMLDPVDNVDNFDIHMAIETINNIDNITDINIVYQSIRVMEMFLEELKISNILNDESEKLEKFVNKINILYNKAKELQTKLDNENKKKIALDILDAIIK